MPSSVKKLASPPAVPESGLGERLRVLRERLGLSQAQFAAKTLERDPEARGVSRTVLIGYEAGKFKPGAREIRAICDAFNVSPQWLLYGDGATQAVANAVETQWLQELRQDLPDLVSVFTVALDLMTLKSHERQAILTLVHGLVSARKSKPTKEALDRLAWHMALDAERRLDALTGREGAYEELKSFRGTDLIEHFIKKYEAAHGKTAGRESPGSSGK